MNSDNYTNQLNSIKKFLSENNAKLISHYYVDSEIQKITEDTGDVLQIPCKWLNLALNKKNKILLLQVLSLWVKPLKYSTLKKISLSLIRTQHVLLTRAVAMNHLRTIVINILIGKLCIC